MEAEIEFENNDKNSLKTLAISSDIDDSLKSKFNTTRIYKRHAIDGSLNHTGYNRLHNGKYSKYQRGNYKSSIENGDEVVIGQEIKIKKMSYDKEKKENYNDKQNSNYMRQSSGWETEKDKAMFNEGKSGIDIAFLMKDRQQMSKIRKLNRKKRTPWKFEIRGYWSDDSSSESDEESYEEDEYSREDCSSESEDFSGSSKKIIPTSGWEQNYKRGREKYKYEEQNKINKYSIRQKEKELVSTRIDSGYGEEKFNKAQINDFSAVEGYEPNKKVSNFNDSVVKKNVTVFSSSVRMKVSQKTTLTNATNILYLVLPSKYNISDNSLVAITGNNTIVITQNMMNAPADVKVKPPYKNYQNITYQATKAGGSNYTRRRRYIHNDGLNEDNAFNKWLTHFALSSAQKIKNVKKRELDENQSLETPANYHNSDGNDDSGGNDDSVGDNSYQSELNTDIFPRSNFEDIDIQNNRQEILNYDDGSLDYEDEGLWTEYFEMM
jgi:hypothetical protein